MALSESDLQTRGLELRIDNVSSAGSADITGGLAARIFIVEATSLSGAAPSSILEIFDSLTVGAGGAGDVIIRAGANLTTQFRFFPNGIRFATGLSVLPTIATDGGHVAVYWIVDD